MGIIEGNVHSESLGTFTSTTSMHSEERSRSLVIKNGEVGLLQYKRRKVSAVRDFPPGCGETSSQVRITPAEEVTLSVTADVFVGVHPDVPRNSVVHVAGDCAPFCEPVSPQKNLSPVEDAPCLGSTEDSHGGLPEVPRNSEVHVSRNYPPNCEPVAQINLSPSEDAACVVCKEDLQGGLLEVEHVTRDCAPGCGAKSPQINLSPVEDAACAGSTENLRDELPEVPRNLDVHSSRDFSPCCILSPKHNLRADEDAECAGPTDNPLGRILELPKSLDIHIATNVVESVPELQPMSTCQEDGGKLMEVESLNNKADKHLESSKDSKLIDHGIFVDHNISSLSKDLHETHVPIHKEETIYSSLKNLVIDSKLPVSNTIGLKKVDRKFPPRRRVSAVRDFPPFCGREAPLLSKQESVKVNEMNLDLVSRVDDKPSTEISKTNAKKMGESYHPGRANNKFLENDSKLSADKVQAIDAVLTSKAREIKYETEIGTEVSREKCHKASLNNSNRVNCKPDINGNKVNHSLSIKKKSSDQYAHQSQGKMKSSMGSEFPSDRVIVQALMASSNCPWRQGKSLKGESGTSPKTKVKKNIDAKISGEKSKMKSNATRGGTSQQIILSEAMLEHVPGKKYKRIANTAHGGLGNTLVQYEDMLEHENHGFRNSHRCRNNDVSLTPGQSNQSGKALDSDATDPRTKVRETLRLFQVVCRRLLQEEEARSKKGGNSNKRVDLQAAKILKDKGKYVNEGKQIMGSVPGVEVGDEFRYRVELNIIGLHRQIQGGIDYVKHAGKILTTSIVASGGYSDDLDCANTLVYTGQGGNVMNSGKEPEDQKLERGNLAMKNSFDEQNHVRVIRGSDISEGRTYVYDGLYLVKKWWQDMGPHGKLVFKFLLDRIPNQQELAWKELRKSTKFKVREGLCIEDISHGKESCPISAMNTIDDEKPPPFTYITRNIYPDWCHPIPPKGCDCNNGCSDSERCICAVKNGGEIPYNHNEAIVEAKSLVYECGPKCKCSLSCYNRVSQKGIKFRLEIFKTESRGWGVRSLNSIPSGSFICEYVGEVIDEKEAEQRSNDEYLFDIGNNYKDSSLRDELSTLMPDAQASTSEAVGEGNFTIDGAKYGNVGRFINHCCFPNLYAQNVLYDHEDKRIPHIMFFAAENIPPLQELTYHYNYTIDQVRDPNGNIKKKSCYCGSVECTGRMY